MTNSTDRSGLRKKAASIFNIIREIYDTYTTMAPVLEDIAKRLDENTKTLTDLNTRISKLEGKFDLTKESIRNELRAEFIKDITVIQMQIENMKK